MYGLKLGSRHFDDVFRKLILMWLLSVIFESVFCATLDVHRIVLKTNTRRNRDRDNYKYRPEIRPTRKPTAQDSNEDDWSAVTQKTVHQNPNNYRAHHKNESNKRGKPRNYHAPKPLTIADVEFTTAYPEKLPIPLIESTFHKYYLPNNSLDAGTSGAYHLLQQFQGKVRQHREKETPKNITKGYEVYEEIIGDVSPPPPPSIKYNHIPPGVLSALPAARKRLIIANPTTSSPVVTATDEGNHIKETSSNSSEENKTYGRRTQSVRNRGNKKFE